MKSIFLEIRKSCRARVLTIKNNPTINKDEAMVEGLADFEVILNNPNLDDAKVDAELVAQFRQMDKTLTDMNALFIKQAQVQADIKKAFGSKIAENFDKNTLMRKCRDTIAELKEDEEYMLDSENAKFIHDTEVLLGDGAAAESEAEIQPQYLKTVHETLQERQKLWQETHTGSVYDPIMDKTDEEVQDELARLITNYAGRV